MARGNATQTNDIRDFPPGTFFIPAKSSMIYLMIKAYDKTHADVVAVNTQTNNRFGAKYAYNKDFNKSEATHFNSKTHKQVWDRLFKKMEWL